MKHIIAVLLVCSSPLLISAQSLKSIDDCVNMALSNSIQLQIADENTKIAANTKTQTITAFLPHASIVGSYQWLEKDIKLIDYNKLDVATLLPTYMRHLTELDIHNIMIGGVTVVQPIFLGGKLIATTQAAKYGKQLAIEQKRNLQNEVIILTKQNYWTVVSLAQKKKLAAQLVSTLEQNKRDVNILISTGMLTAADSLIIEVRLNEAELAKQKIDDALSIARFNLMQLCGTNLNDSLTLYDETHELTLNTTTNLNYDTANVYQNRSEISNLEIAKKISQKQTAIAVSDYLPNVVLNANYFITNPNLQNGFKNEFGGFFNVGVTVRVPLTGWIGGGYRINSAKVATKIKDYEITAAKEKIELDLKQSIYTYKQTMQSVNKAQKSREKAETNLKTANYSFNEGLISPTLLLDAQTSWLKAETELIDAQISFKIAELNLQRATGQLTAN